MYFFPRKIVVSFQRNSVAALVGVPHGNGNLALSTELIT